MKITTINRIISKICKKVRGNDFSFTRNEYRKYSDFRLFLKKKTFFWSQKTKNQKCLIGLFDTSNDAHLIDDFKNMKH